MTDHAYTIVGHESLLTNQGIPQFQKSESLRIRMKNLWCRVMQSHCSAVSPICPHCPGNKHESQGHILGGCAHPTMKSMIIKRHGKAVHHIATAIRKGPLGNTAIFLDAETEEHSLPNLPQWFPTAPQGHRSKPIDRYDYFPWRLQRERCHQSIHPARWQKARVLCRIWLLR